MPFTVSVVAQTPPVLLLDIVGSVTLADMNSHLDRLAAEITDQGWLETTVYLIIDVTRSDMSFLDAMQGAETHVDARRGSSNDPLTEAAFVGAGSMIKILREMFHRQATDGNFIQLFDSRNEAIAYFINQYQAKRPPDQR